MEFDAPSLLLVFVSAFAGGLVSYFLQWQRSRHEMGHLRESHKTEYMAERTAHHLLMHRGYTDRRFDVIRHAMGGFDDDELRKILVRAGALRVARSDGEEWWCLLSREEERIKKSRAK